MHWSTCCSKAFVSTPDGRGHSCPPSAVGKVYREFALNHGTCHVFSYDQWNKQKKIGTQGSTQNKTATLPRQKLQDLRYKHTWGLTPRYAYNLETLRIEKAGGDISKRKLFMMYFGTTFRHVNMVSF